MPLETASRLGYSSATPCPMKAFKCPWSPLELGDSSLSHAAAQPGSSLQRLLNAFRAHEFHKPRTSSCNRKVGGSSLFGGCENPWTANLHLPGSCPVLDTTLPISPAAMISRPANNMEIVYSATFTFCVCARLNSFLFANPHEEQGIPTGAEDHTSFRPLKILLCYPFLTFRHDFLP